VPASNNTSLAELRANVIASAAVFTFVAFAAFAVVSVFNWFG
jgi:hypothetical protein